MSKYYQVVKASERKPNRQVSDISAEGKFGVLLPWFDNTFFFITTEFCEQEGTNVTDKLDQYEWLEPIPHSEVERLREAITNIQQHIDMWSDEPDRAMRLAQKEIETLTPTTKQR